MNIKVSMETNNTKQQVSRKIRAVVKNLFGLFLLSLFFALPLKAQTTTYIKAESFLFSFKESNDMFLADYGDNVYQLERLGQELRVKQEQLLSGRYHLLIVSHAGPYHNEEADVLNEVSLRANRIRAYMKTSLDIPHECVAFYIDRSGNFRDGVHVYLVYEPLPWFANTSIWYSESRYPEAVKTQLKKYGAIPYVDMYLRGELKGYDRVVYRIDDPLFERSELEDYRLASVVYPASHDGRGKEAPVYEATTITTNESLRLGQRGKPVQSEQPVYKKKTTVKQSRSVAVPAMPAYAITKVPLSPVYLDLQTNLLPWCTVAPSVTLGVGDTKIQTGSFMPNMKVECFFADRWSIALGGLYSDFSYKDKSRDRWSLSKIALESRIWFLPGEFTGFNAGLFAGYGDFDVRGSAIDPDKETLYGRTGRFWSAGASVGYLLPLGAGFSAGANLQGGYQSVSDGKKYRFDKLEDMNYLETNFSSTGFMLGLELNVSYRFRIR